MAQNNSFTCYFPVTRTDPSIPGWAQGETRFKGYGQQTSCRQAEIDLMGLSDADKVTYTLPNPPTAPEATPVWLPRSC